MKKPTETDWTEFSDCEMIDWKRARSLIEHENELTHHRQTWLMTSQGFLFAAYALVASSSVKNIEIAPRLQFVLPVLLAMIAVIGLVISVFIGKSITQAEIQHEAVHKWWSDKHGKSDGRHPDIAGHVHKWLKPSNLPAVFSAFWVLCLLAALGLYLLVRG